MEFIRTGKSTTELYCGAVGFYALKFRETSESLLKYIHSRILDGRDTR